MKILKPHLSLNVTNIDASVAFYERAFGVKATKRRPGYAKFDLEAPLRNLTMQEGERTGVNADHFGIQVESSEDVAAAWTAKLLALDWCEATQHLRLRRAIVERANTWFGRDRHYPALYEPGGDDFLAAGLVEAVLMQRTVDDCSFADWWQQFAPTGDALAHWLQPVAVSDARDARLVHLHGVNLTRAWCWRRLLPELDRKLQPAVATAIDAHLAASAPAATGGDYVATHWLASFLVLALDDA